MPDQPDQELPSGTTVITTVHGQFACPEDWFANVLRSSGGHQRPDIAAMTSLVRPGDVVADVGAFIGTVSIPLADAVGPSGRVIAFEAMPEHAALVRHNAAANGYGDRVQVVNVLISPRTGRIAAQRFDMSSASTWYSVDGFGRDEDVAASHDALPIESTTLDAWFAANGQPGDRPLSLLKIDVEGMELDVLHGAQALIERHRPALQVETAAHQLQRYGATVADVDTFLRSRGYRLYVNLAPRNAASDQFRLGRIVSLRMFGKMLGDVIAVHPQGPVRVPAWQGAVVAHSHIARARLRGPLGRVRRLVGRLRRSKA
jgi:FkbM family methyltransferase